jgi:hypothetical protein
VIEAGLSADVANGSIQADENSVLSRLRSPTFSIPRREATGFLNTALAASKCKR